MRSFFSDKTIWDGGTKSAISVRDGVLQYLGSEIGADDPNRIYTVYRSPATISNAALKMVGIPLTEDHVDLSSTPAGVGVVKNSEIIDFFEDGTNSALAVKNIIDLKHEILDTLGNGKRELSLGYKANLVPHTKYDFEQRDIEPHHLAIVEAGRCGSGCSFIDSGRALILHKIFCDEDGKLNLTKIAEIAMALPDAIKAMPIDELANVMPKLQEIVEAAKTKEIKDESRCINCKHADGCSAKMKRCIERVEGQGKTESSATAICKMSVKDSDFDEDEHPRDDDGKFTASGGGGGGGDGDGDGPDYDNVFETAPESGPKSGNKDDWYEYQVGINEKYSEISKDATVSYFESENKLVDKYGSDFESKATSEELSDLDEKGKTLDESITKLIEHAESEGITKLGIRSNQYKTEPGQELGNSIDGRRGLPKDADLELPGVSTLVLHSYDGFDVENFREDLKRLNKLYHSSGKQLMLVGGRGEEEGTDAEEAIISDPVVIWSSPIDQKFKDKMGGNMPEKEKDLEKKEEEMKDQDPDEEKKDEDKKQEAKDSKINICDTKAFKDAVALAVKAHGRVISKAVNFVDEGYDFSSKSTYQIMKDAVATRYDIKDLATDEIKVAFKLLKKDSNYKNFGDQGIEDAWSKLGEKEL